MPDGSALDISSLRTGDLFGAGTPGKTPDVGLFCSVSEIRGNILHASVINGGWSFRMDRITGLGLPEPRLPHLAGIAALYTGHIPRDARGDYNEILRYMEERLARGETPDERLMGVLDDSESMAFDADGEPRDLGRLPWGKVTRQIAAIDAALAAAPDAPGAKALSDLRAMAFNPQGLSAETPEAVDDVRGRVRDALGMSEYEPPSARVPF